MSKADSTMAVKAKSLRATKRVLACFLALNRHKDRFGRSPEGDAEPQPA